MEGRYSEAVDTWNEVLEQDPDNAAAHNNLGLALTAVITNIVSFCTGILAALILKLATTAASSPDPDQ